MALLQYALDLAAHGCAVVPVANDGTKRPAVDWKSYQHTPPITDQLHTWFADAAYDGLGVICGAVSGQLEMLEVEGRAVHLAGALGQVLADHGYAELWSRLCAGWLELSPSGGMHWLYRVDGEARPNTKLARRPNPDNPRLVDVLVETRGEGGFVVTAPSTGRAHSAGLAWSRVAGGPASCPVISVEERDALHALAALLDEMPTVEADGLMTLPRDVNPYADDGSLRPGDDYEHRTTWDEILEPLGWVKARRIGDGFAWTRPGKAVRDGISATTGTAADGVDRLYVFSTSTEFESERPYSKFGAYALLEHAGDHAAAASRLRADGFGSPRVEPVLTLLPRADDGQPTAPPQPPTAAAAATDGATVHQLRPSPAETLARSDDGNAMLLVAQHGDALRHCADRGRWYAWNGTVWAPCPRNAGPAREYAKDVARGLPATGEPAINWKRKTLSAVGISNMLTQAASDPRIAVDYADLDAHPWELNTPGGIVDLRSGQLAPPDPARLHTRLTSCAPDAAADRTAWERFLDVTFNGDSGLIEYLQRLVGYSAVGLVGAHVLPYCHGSGGNGKGVFLETCVKVLGDYGTTAPAGFLMAKQYQGHETEIARLAGARMVLTSEVNDDDRFDEARVKLLTGGDTLTARFMQQDHFTFTPSHQLWAMGNHRPAVRAGGPAFWRRLRLIPFLHEVPAADIIDGLQEKLAGEHGPAVLSWIVEGAVAYARDGLPTPEAVVVATGDYARDQDTVTRFLDELCHLGGGQHVTTKCALVRSAYEDWCRDVGEQPITTKAFGVALARAGIETTRTNTARMYVGLSLLVPDAEGDRSW